MSEETTTTVVETKPSKRALDLAVAARVLSEMGDTKAIDADLVLRSIVMSKNTSRKDRAEALIKSEGVATQGHFAALVINYTIGEGKELAADELTKALAEAFPGAGVGKRHGPHYLCHARKGRLKGLRENLPTIPFRKRTKKAAPSSDGDIKITVETLCEENNRKVLAEMAKGLDVSNKGSKEVIAERIVQAMAAA